MDMKQFRYFLDVVDAQSFTRAAARIHIAQPALSRQVRALEEELGTPLLVRHGRGVQLTDSGKLFKERAETLVRQVDRIQEEISAVSEVAQGEVSLGIPPTLNSMLTTPLVERFTRQYPKVFLRIFVGISETLREHVTNGKIDVGVILASEKTGSLVCDPLLTEPMYLVGHAAKWPDTTSGVNADTIAKVPLLVTSLPNEFRALIQDYFHHHNAEAQIKAEMNSFSLMLGLMRHGVGFTILPRCALYDLPRGTRIRAERIDDLDISWMVATSKDRYHPIASKKLKATLHWGAERIKKDKFLL